MSGMQESIGKILWTKVMKYPTVEILHDPVPPETWKSRLKAICNGEEIVNDKTAPITTVDVFAILSGPPFMQEEE